MNKHNIVRRSVRYSITLFFTKNHQCRLRYSDTIHHYLLSGMSWYALTRVPRSEFRFAPRLFVFYDFPIGFFPFPVTITMDNKGIHIEQASMSFTPMF